MRPLARARVIAAEPSDVAFHTAFLVSPSDSGLATERVEVKVRAKRHPAVRVSTRWENPITWATAALRLS